MFFFFFLSGGVCRACVRNDTNGIWYVFMWWVMQILTVVMRVYCVGGLSRGRLSMGEFSGDRKVAKLASVHKVNDVVLSCSLKYDYVREGINGLLA